MVEISQFSVLCCSKNVLRFQVKGGKDRDLLLCETSFVSCTVHVDVRDGAAYRAERAYMA
jgi:hypothetical protein